MSAHSRTGRAGAQLIGRLVALVLVVVTAGVATGVAVFLAAPRGGARLLAGLTPSVTYFVPDARDAVALTIDDGPDARHTAAILDVLRRHEARATFFVIGARAAEHPELLARMRRDGHELGNHDRYDRRTAAVPAPELARDLAHTHAQLAPFGPVRWFRPGSGVYTPDVLRLAQARGYGVVLGDVYPLDAAIPWHAFHSWYITQHGRPGSIIVLHDGAGRGRRAARTLTAILPLLRARRLDVVTVSELLRRAGRPLAPREPPR